MDPMRLILLAVGGFLVYKATIGKAAAVTPGPTVPSQPTIPDTTRPPATPNGGANPPAGIAIEQQYAALWNEDPTQVSRLAAPFDNGKDYVLARGAIGDTAAINVLNAHGVVFGPDEWNVYHVLGGSPAMSPDAFDTYIVGDRSPITVTEYRARLMSAGLSGIRMGNWGGVWA